MLSIPLGAGLMSSFLFCIIKNDTCYTLRIVTMILRKTFYAALIHDFMRGSVQHKIDLLESEDL